MARRSRGTAYDTHGVFCQIERGSGVVYGRDVLLRGIRVLS